MQLYKPDPDHAPGKPVSLSSKHRRMLLEESEISPEVIAEEIAEGRLRTIDLFGRELPPGFSRRQRRRGAGILFTAPRPNGEVGYSFRPDAPDPEEPGRKYEQPCKALGGSGNVLGVYQTVPGLLQDASVPLVFVEGAKKGLSLLSWAKSTGRPIVIVVISGVWNWLSKDSGRSAPIPDMLALPVEGRECRIAFDSDWKIKAKVHNALARLDAYLKSRDGLVLVWNIPHEGEGKTGLDDYRAGGGDPEDLERDAVPFEPVDVGAERLSRNDKLQASVRYLWRRWHEGDWMHFEGAADKGNWQRGHTARDAMEALIELAAQSGKPDGRGVVVEVGLRRLSRLAAKSPQSVGYALKHLKADGQLEILPATDKAKPRRYRLLVPSAALDSMERGHAKEGEPGESDPRCQGLRYPSAPRLRWSSPARAARLVRHFEASTGRTVTEAVGENIFVPPDYRPYAGRLGPHRGAVLDALEDAGGELHDTSP